VDFEALLRDNPKLMQSANVTAAQLERLGARWAEEEGTGGPLSAGPGCVLDPWGCPFCNLQQYEERMQVTHPP
jgi:hypothetical protein